MAFQPEASVYDAGVFQWETTTPALGGAGGAANAPLLSLANRTKYLKDHIDAIEAALSSNAALNSPAFTGSPTAPTQALGDATTKLATDAFVQNTVYSQVALNVAGNSNVNLTTVQAGAGALKFTGLLTGNINVVVPNAAKRWTVINATTGAFTITLKTAAGAGVVITQGKRTLLECDAVDVFDPKTDFVDAALLGNPTAPTPAAGDNTTKVPTTSFVRQIKAGHGVVNVAGNVNVNLAQGQWGLPMLTLSGVLTGDIAVVVPSASDQWLFNNQTSGGFAVTVRTAIGQGIILTSGATQHLWCDGTDVRIVSGSFDTTYALVRKPSVVNPAAASTVSGLTPTVIANAYYSLYGVPQNGFQAQVSTSGAFGVITWDSGNVGVTTQAQVPAGVLAANTAYFARVRYQDLDGVWSPWSDASTFSTGANAINAPTITAPANGATNVGDGTTLTSSAFSMGTGVDTHQATDWEVWTGANGTGTKIFGDYDNSADKVSITIGTGVFAVNTSYYPRVRYKSAGGLVSAWSASVSFTTAASFSTVLSPGGEFGGGYFGGFIMDGAQRYALVVSPAQYGARSGLDCHANNDVTRAQMLSRNNGWANQQAYIAAGRYSGGQDMFRFCKDLRIAGHADWYVPAVDELEVLYRNLKPTTSQNNIASGANANAYGGATGNYTSGNPAQTTIPAFQRNGSEAFDDGRVKTSTFASASNNNMQVQHWDDGKQDLHTSGDDGYVRAIRRVPA